MENLRVLEGSEVFFRGLQHLHHQFKSGWRLLNTTSKEVVFYCCGGDIFFVASQNRRNWTGNGRTCLLQWFVARMVWKMV